MICTSTLIFLFPSLCLHFHPFISLFLPVCLFLTSSSFMQSFTCFLSYSLDLPAHTNSFKLAFPSFLPHFLLVSALARARAKQPVPASCPYLHVALLSLPLSGIVPMWKGERLWERETRRERRGAKKKGKETRECMQMQGLSRLQICKYCCLCDMQMRDYRALIRVKRTVHVN